LSFFADVLFVGDSPSITKHNFGFDIVRTTIAIMKDYDPSFRLPDDFFEGPVIGVPGEL
jgi:hypothetical protein